MSGSPEVVTALGFGPGGWTVAAVQQADPFDLAEAIRDLSIQDVAGLAEDAAEALVIACERITSAVRARAAVATHTLVHRVQHDLDAGAAAVRAATGQGLPYQAAGDELVPVLLAPALRVATRTAAARVDADCALVAHLPATLAAHWAGDLERHRAQVIADHGHTLPAHLRARYEALVLEPGPPQEGTGPPTPVSARVRDLPRSVLARRAARIARDLDPAHTRAVAERAVAARTVAAWPADTPGMTHWSATLPTATSTRIWAALDQLATQYTTARPGLGRDAARADALADLILAHTSITTTITLLVPALTLTGAALAHPAPAPPSADPRSPLGLLTHPAGPTPPTGTPATGTPAGTTPAGATPAGGTPAGTTPAAATAGGTPAGGTGPGQPVCWVVPGVVEHPQVGALLPEAVAGLLADPATQLRLARLDPDGTIHTDPRTHDPGAALRRAVQTRDGTCRFPGCHTPAQHCDLDHVIAFPHGPTRIDNLVCLCRRHHRFKHHGGWTPTLTPDGVLHWATPDGRTYPTHPHGGRTLTDLGLPTPAAEPHDNPNADPAAPPRDNHNAGNGNGDHSDGAGNANPDTPDTVPVPGPGATAATPPAAESPHVEQADKIAAAGDGKPGAATRKDGTTTAEAAAGPSPLEEHLATIVTLPNRPAPHHATPCYDLHLPRAGDPPITLVA